MDPVMIIISLHDATAAMNVYVHAYRSFGYKLHTKNTNKLLWLAGAIPITCESIFPL